MTASAHTQTTAASTPSTPQTPPPAPRPLEIYCRLDDGKEHCHGALISIRAQFLPGREQVRIKAISDSHRFAQLFLRHAAARAVLYSTRESLAVLARFQTWHGRDADLKHLPQFNASDFNTGVSSAVSSADVTVIPNPVRDIIHLTAVCIRGGLEARVDLYLTPLEAEALALDLERALREMERCTIDL